MTQDETQHTLGQFDEIEDLIEEAKELEHLKEINQELLEALEKLRNKADTAIDSAFKHYIDSTIAKARGQQ